MPAHPATIRPALPHEAPSLAALALQVFLDTYATQGMRPAIADYVLGTFTAQAFADTLARPTQQVLVAERQGHLVGLVVLDLDAPCPEPQGPGSELTRLYVPRQFAGQGIGSALLAAAQQLAQERSGSSAVWLTVNAQNQPAQAFYTRLGFVQLGTCYFTFANESHLNLVLRSPEQLATVGATPAGQTR